MFHAGTVDNKNKISGEEMYDELLKRAQRGEFDQNDIPKVSTINNWIATFSRKWKQNMARLSLEGSETPGTSK